MLTAGDIDRIQSNITSIEQDWFALAPILGEAGLERDHVYFFDGETLYLSDRCLSDKYVLADALQSLLRRYRPTRLDLNLTGISDANLLDAERMTRELLPASENINWEVALAFCGDSLLRFQRRFAQVMHRDSTTVCRLRPCGPLTPNHRELVEAHIAEFDDGSNPFDVTNVRVMPHHLAVSEFGVTIDAYREGRLVGFVQGHQRYAPRLGVLSFCVAPDRPSQLCDVLYAAFLHRMLNNGVRACNLGMTLWPGLCRYKLKWGALPLAGPYRQEVWLRRQPFRSPIARAGATG